MQERLDVLNGLEVSVPMLGKNWVVPDVPRQGGGPDLSQELGTGAATSGSCIIARGKSAVSAASSTT